MGHLHLQGLHTYGRMREQGPHQPNKQNTSSDFKECAIDCELLQNALDILDRVGVQLREAVEATQ